MSDEENLFNDINDLNELRGHMIGRIKAIAGYNMAGYSGSITPKKDIKNLMEQYDDRKREITE